MVYMVYQHRSRRSMSTRLLEIYGEKAIEKTKELMRGYYAKKVSPRDIAEIVSNQGFSWIGASSGEWFPDGKKGIQFFSHQWDYGDVPLIHMDRDEYGLQQVGESAILVCCQCRLTTDPSSGRILSEIQRGTLVYHVEDENLRLAHIHVSNEWQVMERYEKFADTQGRANYEYMQQLVAEKKLGTVEELSPRQREVLNLLKQGHTYKSIGEIMKISPRTVRYHVNEMCVKYHVTSKNQLLALIIQ